MLPPVAAYIGVNASRRYPKKRKDQRLLWVADRRESRIEGSNDTSQAGKEGARAQNLLGNRPRFHAEKNWKMTLGRSPDLRDEATSLRLQISRLPRFPEWLSGRSIFPNTVAGPRRTCTGSPVMPSRAPRMSERDDSTAALNLKNRLAEKVVVQMSDEASSLGPARSGQPQHRTVHTSRLKRRSVRVTGEMSKRQKLCAGRRSAYTIAARITEGCVTAMVCFTSVCSSSHFPPLPI